MTIKEEHKLIIKKWIRGENISRIWQNFSRKELKILGISNLKERVKGENKHNKDLFFKYAGEYIPTYKVINFILQNYPLSKEEGKNAFKLLNKITDLKKKIIRDNNKQ